MDRYCRRTLGHPLLFTPHATGHLPVHPPRYPRSQWYISTEHQKEAQPDRPQPKTAYFFDISRNLHLPDLLDYLSYSPVHTLSLSLCFSLKMVFLDDNFSNLNLNI